MTIIYQYKVATTSVCGFFKLLRRWKGSVYKLMFKEMLIFCALYAIISFTYRLALTEHQRSLFGQIARYCNSYTNLIPVSFVLGFYVSLVVTRWWQQFSNVPWPDRTLFILSTYLPGLDERARILRRTVARYMMFGFILILRSISVAVMKRFPTLEHIVDAGFITTEEAQAYERVCCKYNKFWVPLVWANSVLSQARREGRIDSDIGLRLIMEYLADFRDKCSLCFVYDWITIPLVYTQVVTLSVHMFFVACLIGRQYVDSNDDDHPDLYVPVFTILQFFFYMGWLKVAEQLINPFGEDDDDFDMNWLLDRHAAVAMCLVDQCHGSYPNLVRDVHFNEIIQDLPYTEASKSSRRPNFMGSTYNLARPSIAEQRVLSPMNMPPDVPVTGGRHRSNTTRSGINGSLWSLFGFKHSLQRSQLSGSRETMMSTSTFANGHVGLGPANHMGAGGLHPPLHRESYGHESDPGDLQPYVPLRRVRAGTDVEHRPLRRLIDSDRERKWSFPLSLLRRKQGREGGDRAMSEADSSSLLKGESTDHHGVFSGDPYPLNQQFVAPGSPGPPQVHRSRFTVESVLDDQEVDSSKAARNKALLDKHMGYMSGMSVSRPPVLSAIEEGNTIRSIKELIPSPSSHSLESMHEIKEEHDDIDDVFASRSNADDTRIYDTNDVIKSDITHDTGHDTNHDAMYDTNRDAMYDTSHGTNRDTIYDIVPDTDRDTLHDSGRDTTRATIYDIVRDTDRDTLHDSGRDTTRDTLYGTDHDPTQREDEASEIDSRDVQIPHFTFDEA